MECPIDQTDQPPALQHLDESAFLEMLGRKGVSLRIVQGELRVSAPTGVVLPELLQELRRRKSNLLLLLEGRIQRRVSFGERRTESASDTSQDAQLAYWMARLAGVPTVLELPFSRTRPPVATLDNGSVSFEIPHDVGDALRQFAKSEDCSLTTVLFGAFSALLFRETERNDFCIGARVSVERSEGNSRWHNILAFRCQMNGDLSFRSWIGSFNRLVSEALKNKTVPYEVLPAQLKLEAIQGIAPICQILFDVDLADDVAESLSGASGVVLGPQRESNQSSPGFDVTLQMDRNVDSTLSGSFVFRKDIYAADDIREFASTFCTLLRACAFEEGRPIGELSVLSPFQQQQMLVDWNRTELKVPEISTIHELFECQASKTPHAIAVAHGTETISYESLNQRANQLAHLLLSRRVRIEEPVGICMTRSIEMIVAMLGVLKSGACYLPLDPSHPTDRLDSILVESKTRIVISERAIVRSIALHAEEFLQIDSAVEELAAFPKSNANIPVSPQHLAYIIYTSGSTGRPKGVAIEHHSTVSFIHWAQECFTSHELSRVLASTSICFDLSVFEIFVPLSLGHTSVLVTDLLDFAQKQEESAISLINTVPSVLSAVLVSNRLKGAVVCINLAGEPLSQSLIKRIEQDLPSARIFDLYGPTETTTYSTMALRNGDQPATIGRPIGNTKIFVVDSRLQPVPLHVPGQLLIGGEGVARGYLNQPEMSAQSFVTLEHLPISGRLYKTGDLVRYKQDGSLEYLGRIDRQVKLRGFRIELSEIESVFRRNDSILETVVALRDEDIQNKTLVAYVVPRALPPATAELVAFQRAFLPPYMIATEIVFLDKMPLTPNGKVDMKALKGLKVAKQEDSKPEPESISYIEQELLLIWEKYFKRNSIRVDDDFFALGGHSLLAYQIFAEIEKKLRTELMLSVLFKAPTIRLLALEVERAANG